MKAYSSMKPAEFIDQIRDALIRANAAPLVIDQVDQLRELPSPDEQEEALGAEYDRGYDQAENDMRDEVADLERHVAELQKQIADD